MADIKRDHLLRVGPMLAHEVATHIEADSLGPALFALQDLHVNLDSHLWYVVIHDVFGIDPDATDDWPDFEDITLDRYDSSIEFKRCGPSFSLDDGRWEILRTRGFQRCWVCYRDGSEKYYA